MLSAAISCPKQKCGDRTLGTQFEVDLLRGSRERCLGREARTGAPLMVLQPSSWMFVSGRWNVFEIRWPPLSLQEARQMSLFILCARRSLTLQQDAMYRSERIHYNVLVVEYLAIQLSPRCSSRSVFLCYHKKRVGAQRQRIGVPQGPTCNG